MKQNIPQLKKLVTGLLLLMFVLPVSVAKAQQKGNTSLFYYFGAQKVPLRQSSDKLYIRVPASAAGQVREELQGRYGLGSNSFSETEDLNFLVVDLKQAGSSTNTIKDVSAYIKANMPKVEMVRPVLLASDGTEEVIDEWFYVKLRQGVTQSDLQEALSNYNCAVDRPYPYNERIFILKATAANGYDGLRMANLFYETGLFEYAEPDFRALQLLHTPPPPPNDAFYNMQWSHINTGQYSGTAGADMKVDSAWTITQGNPAIRIAVIDEGVQRNHPDLVNNIDPLGFGLDASVATTGDILSTSLAHGTNVAGIIAAQANNSIGVAGIAPNCKIIPVNVTVNTSGSYGTSAQLATCIDWAWNTGGADVLSNSWGGGSASSLIRDAIHNAVTLGRYGKGAVVLFSSGNNDAGLASPAIFEDAIAVGAMSMCYQRKSTTSCDGENFWGGNYGVGLDISAPGVKIHSTDITGTGGYNTSSGTAGDYYASFNGTSSACPNASGVVALMLSADTALTVARVKEIIERTARKVGGYSYQHVPGQPNGTWSSELGHGMINAYQAVLAAQNNTQYCPVQITAAGSLQMCTGSSVALQVANPDAAATYTWLQNGSVLSGVSGTSYNATASGSYTVAISKTGCADTSYALQVTMASPNGTLQAHAGNDTTITGNSKIIIGGGPAATGGTALLHPMRGFVSNISSNQLLRFDPQQPALNYKVVKDNFMPNYDGNSTFFTGAAATPYGLYMVMRTDRYLAKIDTATGDVINIGSLGVSVDMNGMTYDPKTGKIFAIGGSNNALYEINRSTGQATFIANTSLSSPLIISLSADTAGVLYGVTLFSTSAAGSGLYTINKTTGVATFVGNTGYKGSYAQDGAIDLLTNELYACPYSSALNNSKYTGSGLWNLNKTTGAGTLIGAIALPYNQPDAMAFAGAEYKYEWTPATGLSNPYDGNPQFAPFATGTFTYILTTTDLCGNTAKDTVNITVTCPSTFTPASLSAINVGNTSAILTWATVADSFRIEYGLQNFTPGTGTIITGIMQNSYNLTGLTATTAYSYYVQAYCGGTASTWVGPYTFTTAQCPWTSQCYYTFNLIDDYGDGWNGGSMQVKQNGVVVQTLSLSNGYGTTALVPLCHSMPFELFWNVAGSYPTEIGITVQDATGVQLYTKPVGTGSASTVTPLYTGTVVCQSVLPVAGITLTGVAEHETAKLKWIVNNEQEIMKYEAEKSADGVNYRKIYTTLAKNNDKTDATYEWQDTEMQAGSNYYRIGAVSYNGEKTYSNTIKLNAAASAGDGIRIFPNPATGNGMNIQFSNVADGSYELKMYNLSGAVVFRTTVQHSGGNAIHTVSFDKGMAAGVYHVNVVNSATGAAYRQNMMVR